MNYQISKAGLTSIVNSAYAMACLYILTLVVISGCSDYHNKRQKSDLKPNNHMQKDSGFQELGFIPVKPGHWNELVEAIQNNIAHSRDEADNLAFELYQPEGNHNLAIWFERYKTASGHDNHKKQPYFQAAIKVIKASLNGELKSFTLKELAAFPVMHPKTVPDFQTTLHVFVLFNVKADERTRFVELMTAFMPKVRKAKGNIAFNIFQDASDQSKFVLMENWKSTITHKEHEQSDYAQQLHKDFAGLFVSDPMQTRWLANDISLK